MEKESEGIKQTLITVALNTETSEFKIWYLVFIEVTRFARNYQTYPACHIPPTLPKTGQLSFIFHHFLTQQK